MFRQALEGVPAVARWSDAYLQRVGGGTLVDVEPLVQPVPLLNDEGNLVGNPELLAQLALPEFVGGYQSEPWYGLTSLDALDAQLQRDLSIPPVLCSAIAHTGTTLRAQVWMSNGGTRALAHSDTNEENVVMQIRGRKTVHLLRYDEDSHARLGLNETGTFEEEGYTWTSGVLAGVHAASAPGWQSVTLEAGDVLLVPAWWLHALEADEPPDGNNIMVNVFFRSFPAQPQSTYLQLQNRHSCGRKRFCALRAATLRANPARPYEAAQPAWERARCVGVSWYDVLRTHPAPPAHGISTANQRDTSVGETVAAHHQRRSASST